MSCARSSGRARVGDPSSRLGLGSSSSKESVISSGWIEKSTKESRATTGGSGAATEGICVSSGKRSKTEEEDREARK